MKKVLCILVAALSLAAAGSRAMVVTPLDPPEPLVPFCVRHCTPQPPPSDVPRYDYPRWCPVYECHAHDGEEVCHYHYERC